jgi:alkanesulfonate monooxygenase SsuD/methylene tetrahydromethanopterin reductase-like flavin-dependent oxidoreductase (luciferase family)
MKFVLITLITHHPDLVAGTRKSPADRLRDVVDAAALAEDLGFYGFAVGERRERPLVAQSSRKEVVV